MTAIDNTYLFLRGNKLRDFFDRTHCRRQSDSLQWRTAGFDNQVIQTGKRQRKMRAALVVNQRMDFIDNHGLRGLEHFAAALSGEEDEQRFGRRDQNVGRAPDHLLPFVHRRVAGPHGNADWRQ